LIKPGIIACLYAYSITDRENKIIEKAISLSPAS